MGCGQPSVERVALQISGSNLGTGTVRLNHIKLSVFARLVLLSSE